MAKKGSKQDPKQKAVSTPCGNGIFEAKGRKNGEKAAFQECELVTTETEGAPPAIEDFRRFMKGERFPTIQHPKKRAALWALSKTCGLVSKAARMARFDASTHHAWMGNDPDYKQAYEEIREEMIDLAEDGLVNLIRGVKVLTPDGSTVYSQPPNVTACMSVLNNIGGRRGYGNKVEIKHTGGKVIRPKTVSDEGGK